MNIDIYIDLLKDHCTNLDNEECDTMAEWLEELKQIRQWKADIINELSECDCNSIDEVKHNARNKAIDDFARKIKPYIAEYRSAIEHNRYAFIDVNNIAEQLKEQN